jgi:hypothetical protein
LFRNRDRNWKPGRLRDDLPAGLAEMSLEWGTGAVLALDPDEEYSQTNLLHCRNSSGQAEDRSLG